MFNNSNFSNLFMIFTFFVLFYLFFDHIIKHSHKKSNVEVTCFFFLKSDTMLNQSCMHLHVLNKAELNEKELECRLSKFWVVILSSVESMAVASRLSI